MRACSERESTLCAIADHVVSEGQPVEKGRPMCAEMTELVSQATLRNVIGGIPGFFEEAVKVLGTFEGRNRVRSADNRLLVMLQGSVNRTFDERLNCAELDGWLCQKIEEATPSRLKLKKVTKSISEDQDFIAPVVTIEKKETKKAIKNRSEREDRHRKFAEVAYSTSARSTSSSDRPSADISDERTIVNAYSEMRE